MKKNTTQTEITLCQKLRRVREHLGLSRPKMAEMLDVPPTTLKNYELAYRVSVPASLIIKFTSTPDLCRFAIYLIDENLSVDYYQPKGEPLSESE